MKKKIRKKKRKSWIKKRSKSSSILPILLVIALLSLFSETMRTLPAGAKSESFTNISFELPNLNYILDFYNKILGFYNNELEMQSFYKYWKEIVPIHN